MTRIVWNDYIREQFHWAERLSELAREGDGGNTERLTLEADRARQNAQAVTGEPAGPDGVCAPV